MDEEALLKVSWSRNVNCSFHRRVLNEILSISFSGRILSPCLMDRVYLQFEIDTHFNYAVGTYIMLPFNYSQV